MAGLPFKNTQDYFCRAQRHENDRFGVVNPTYDADMATKVLYADCWKKALDLTDVLEFMPQTRRDEWSKLIYDFDTPEFEENIVKTTLKDLLAKRKMFFGEMVDGIFFGLSRHHVTNRPEGFSKRMILAAVLTPGDTLSGTGELVHDLRYVVSKLMGRDAPKRNSTGRALCGALEESGEWHLLDGGAIKLKVFKKRTAHLEVHPDIAWQLNQILAINNPMAIPSKFRQPPKKSLKEVPLNYNLISNGALYLLKEGRFHRGEHRVFKDKTFYLGLVGADANKATIDEAAKVLEMLGGVPGEGKSRSYQFDYDITDVIRKIEATGMVPETTSHQYYPTQEELATIAIDLAEIDEHHQCLEPNAGTGGLARLMPKDRTQCVEIGKLFCSSLESQGFTTENADFLTWGPDKTFDRIVMNPPFSKGRALGHLSHADHLLGVDGRLVAILPASLMGKELVPGMSHTWHGPYQDQFAGTGVRVAILVLEA
jgi:hypothetical protein